MEVSVERADRRQIQRLFRICSVGRTSLLIPEGVPRG
jgi:hypothetical protein